MSNHQEIISHGENKDAAAMSNAEKSCHPRRFVAEITPVLWQDGTAQYRIVEEPLTAGDMRQVYFVDA